MTSRRTNNPFGVLRVPGAPLTFTTALIGRVAYALVFLPLLYAVTDASSIAMAGLAVALYGAGASFLAPVRAALIDRFGPHRMLTVFSLAFAGSLAALGTLSLLGAAAWTLVAGAAFAGCVAPPLGPTMRVAWADLTRTPDELTRALSLDAVVEEVMYLAGPAVAGLALAFAPPGAALLAPAVLIAVGGLAFAATPVVRHRSRQTTADTARRGTVLRRPFLGVIVAAGIAGALSGSASVAVPVIVADFGGSATAGIALGLFAGGSAVGGLLFGMMNIRGTTRRKLLVLVGALTVAMSALALASDVMSVFVVLAGAGLFFSPVMVVAYVAANDAGDETQRNATTTWVNTGHNLGAAIGSGAIGWLIATVMMPAAWWAVIAVAAALLAAASVLSLPPRQLRPHEVMRMS